MRPGADDVVVLRTTALAADGEVTVELVDADGNPIEGVYVIPRPRPGGHQPQKTDAAGRVTLRGLLRQQITLSASVPALPGRASLNPPEQTVLPEGQLVRMRARRAVRVPLRLELPDDFDLRQAWVTLFVGSQMVWHLGFTPQAEEHFVFLDPEASENMRVGGHGHLHGGARTRWGSARACGPMQRRSASPCAAGSRAALAQRDRQRSRSV